MLNIRSLLFDPPDEVLVEVAAGGERFAAAARLWMMSIIWVFSLIITLITGDTRPEFMPVTIGCTLLLGVACLYAYAIHSKQVNTTWHFVISISDITFVSATLFAMTFVQLPELALNNMLIWEGYLLFILASCLYFDVRVCLVATLTAIVQYALIVWWCLKKYTFPIINPESVVFTGFVPYIQLSRFFLLVIAAVIGIGLILRSRSLLSHSGTDTLTGLVNRRVFEAHLAQEISRARRHKLKDFNSKWGHAVGDEVLKLLSSSMRKTKRTEDVVARWGGEEFVGLFPVATKQDILQLTQRLADNLKNQTLPIADKNQRICFSAGISEFPIDGTDADTLIRIADERLSTAKENGRDQVVIA